MSNSSAPAAATASRRPTTAASTPQAAVSAAIEDWCPAVVLREPAEFGSLAAAVRAGVPHLQVAIGMTEMSSLFVDLTAEPLTELARAAGLPESALVDAAAAEPVLSSVPEVLDRAGDDAYDSTTGRGPSPPPAVKAV